MISKLGKEISHARVLEEPLLCLLAVLVHSVSDQYKVNRCISAHRFDIPLLVMVTQNNWQNRRSEFKHLFGVKDRWVKAKQVLSEEESLLEQVLLAKIVLESDLIVVWYWALPICCQVFIVILGKSVFQRLIHFISEGCLEDLEFSRGVIVHERVQLAEILAHFHANKVSILEDELLHKVLCWLTFSFSPSIQDWLEETFVKFSHWSEGSASIKEIKLLVVFFRVNCNDFLVHEA